MGLQTNPYRWYLGLFLHPNSMWFDLDPQLIYCNHGYVNLFEHKPTPNSTKVGLDSVLRGQLVPSKAVIYPYSPSQFWFYERLGFWSP